MVNYVSCTVCLREGINNKKYSLMESFQCLIRPEMRRNIFPYFGSPLPSIPSQAKLFFFTDFSLLGLLMETFHQNIFFIIYALPYLTVPMSVTLS